MSERPIMDRAPLDLPTRSDLDCFLDVDYIILEWYVIAISHTTHPPISVSVHPFPLRSIENITSGFYPLIAPPKMPTTPLSSFDFVFGMRYHSY